MSMRGRYGLLGLALASVAGGCGGTERQTQQAGDAIESGAPGAHPNTVFLQWLCGDKGRPCADHAWEGAGTSPDANTPSVITSGRVAAMTDAPGVTFLAIRFINNLGKPQYLKLKKAEVGITFHPSVTPAYRRDLLALAQGDDTALGRLPNSVADIAVLSFKTAPAKAERVTDILTGATDGKPIVGLGSVDFPDSPNTNVHVDGIEADGIVVFGNETKPARPFRGGSTGNLVAQKVTDLYVISYAVTPEVLPDACEVGLRGRLDDGDIGGPWYSLRLPARSTVGPLRPGECPGCDMIQMATESRDVCLTLASAYPKASGGYDIRFTPQTLPVFATVLAGADDVQAKLIAEQNKWVAQVANDSVAKRPLTSHSLVARIDLATRTDAAAIYRGQTMKRWVQDTIRRDPSTGRYVGP